MRQLVELQGILPQIRAQGYRLLAVGPDEPDQARELAARRGLDYPILCDEGLAFTRRLGIVFQAPERDPLPVPAVFLVDGEGTIVFHFVHPDYRLRLNPELLIAATKVEPARPPAGRE